MDRFLILSGLYRNRHRQGGKTAVGGKLVLPEYTLPIWARCHAELTKCDNVFPCACLILAEYPLPILASSHAELTEVIRFACVFVLSLQRTLQKVTNVLIKTIGPRTDINTQFCFCYLQIQIQTSILFSLNVIIGGAAYITIHI